MPQVSRSPDSDHLYMDCQAAAGVDGDVQASALTAGDCQTEARVPLQRQPEQPESTRRHPRCGAGGGKSTSARP